MADLTKETIEELRGLLAKATPGPWSIHPVDDTTIISPAREVATTCDSAQTEREDGYNIEYEQMEVDAAFIVAMRNALPALLASLASKEGECEGLRASLALRDATIEQQIPRERELRMDAYYYQFDPTGVPEIDLILCAVATAGKAYHHTGQWSEECNPLGEPLSGETPTAWIQNAAIDAATAWNRRIAKNGGR